MPGNLVIDKIPFTMAKNVQVCYALPWKSEHDQKYQSSPTFMALFVHRLTTDAFIIKDLFFNEINLLTEDINKETGLYMISLIAQLKDN